MLHLFFYLLLLLSLPTQASCLRDFLEGMHITTPKMTPSSSIPPSPTADWRVANPELPFEGDMMAVKENLPTKAVAKSWNQGLLNSLKAEPVRTTRLGPAERDELFAVVRDHPVASRAKVPDYDPEGRIGFCFGRAACAHLEASMRKVPKEDIRRFYIVGKLRSSDGTNWQYHVTTAVRGEDGLWYAIDPITSRPMPIDDWYQLMAKSFDPDGRMMMFQDKEPTKDLGQMVKSVKLSSAGRPYEIGGPLRDTLSKDPDHAKEIDKFKIQVDTIRYFRHLFDETKLRAKELGAKRAALQKAQTAAKEAE